MQFTHRAPQEKPDGPGVYTVHNDDRNARIKTSVMILTLILMMADHEHSIVVHRLPGRHGPCRQCQINVSLQTFIIKQMFS